MIKGKDFVSTGHCIDDPQRSIGTGAEGVHDHIRAINLSEVPEGVIKEYLAHSAKGHSIFDSFDMIEGRNGLYSLADLSPTLKQHFKHVVFRGVKYIDRNRGGNNNAN